MPIPDDNLDSDAATDRLAPVWPAGKGPRLEMGRRKYLTRLKIPPFLKQSFKALTLAGLIGYVWGGVSVLGWVALNSNDLPSLDTLYERNRPVSVQIVDHVGRDLIVRGANAQAGSDVATLPPHVTQAIFATEDRRYNTHIGIDPLGLLRAVIANIQAGRVVQGGSTLTQQLIKNVFLTPDQTLKRKTQEAMLAIWLEQNYTKTEILDMYLSRVYFGSGTWGLEAASQTYFGREAKALTLPQAAMLAGVLKAPSRYNPISNNQVTAARTTTVLNAMFDAGYIDRWAHYTALQTPLQVQSVKTDDSVNYFVDWIWPMIEAEIGVPRQDIVIQTTLDRDAQRQAGLALNSHLDPARHASQGALVSINGQGAVRAMVGGASYAQSQFNRASQAQRQPGSAFKPFVYLAAFKAGLDPWDRRIDQAITLGDWSPRNFKKGHKGEMTLQDAFSQSINTIAVGLTEEVGRERVIETAQRFGIDGLQPLRSLALGAQVTSPLILTQSYLPFANWGKRPDVHGILSIATANGTPLYTHNATPPEPVLDVASLGHMNRIMMQTVRHGTGRRASIDGYDIGGKTGTTNDFRDAWFVGYVPDLVTGVWVGADDYTPMSRVTGGSIPADIFKDYMIDVLDDKPETRLPVSQLPISGRKIDRLEVLLKDIEKTLP